mgnify:FL=1
MTLGIESLMNVNLDDDAFVDGVPHETFALLRREAPVYWSEWKGGGGYWSITRHKDILDILRDSKRFSSEKGANLEDWDSDQALARRSMLESDPPRHAKYRKIVGPDFSPRAVRRYEDFVREITRSVLDRVLEMGEFDFVEDFAAEIPMRVFARIMGVPAEDADQLIQWGDEMMGNTDPDVTTVSLYSAASEKYRLYPFSNPAGQKVIAYGRALREQRRKNPTNDLISKLSHAEIDGRPLTDWEFDNNFLLLIVAGHETTRQAIIHGMEAFNLHPDEITRLQNNPDLMPAAVEEILRWATPVLHFRRTATEDVEMHGKTIRAGDKVVLWFISANRDETVFAEPYQFDVARTPNEHVTFGRTGIHFCLGTHLARLEVKVVYEELLPYLHRFQLTDKPLRMRSNFTNGIRYLPIKVKPE